MAAAVTALGTVEEQPNSGIKSVIILVDTATAQNDTLAVTLADHGINATGLLGIRSWVHTTSGSVIVVEANTSSVSSGVLTLTFTSANTAVRVIELVGRSTVGVFV